MTIKDLKRGDFFTLKPIENPTDKQVYIRGKYDRSTRKYTCTRFDDCCATRDFPGSKTIFTDFTF